MRQSIVAILVLSSTVLLSSCVGGSANNEVSYDTYEPGYTGYTVGAGAYSIPNGYGPAFWSPGYYNYTGHDTGSQGYIGYYGCHGGRCR